MVYLDFSKAFDSVPHQRLLLKREGYGVSGPVLEWIKSFFRQQQVVVAGFESSWADVMSQGVPQGSVRFGPVLFICYINDND